MSETGEGNRRTGEEERAVELVSRLTRRITNLHTTAQAVACEAVGVEQDLRFLLLEITDHLTRFNTLSQELGKLLARYQDLDAEKKMPQKKRGRTGRRTKATRKPG